MLAGHPAPYGTRTYLVRYRSTAGLASFVPGLLRYRTVSWHTVWCTVISRLSAHFLKCAPQLSAHKNPKKYGSTFYVHLHLVFTTYTYCTKKNSRVV